LLKVLGQAVSAVDLSLLVPETLLHHAFHQAVDHSFFRLLPERIFRSSPCIRMLMKDSVPLYRLVAIISVILLLALVEMGWR
jgi:hypothetical protein